MLPQVLLKLIVFSHVAAGSVALVVAPVVLSVKRGGRTHITWGKVFFWCMTYVFVTAVVLSVVKWIPFLLMIAFFAYYSLIIGYRALYQKQIHLGKGIRWYDWLAVVVAGVANTAFVGYGMYLLVGNEITFGLLAVGFGVGGCIQVFSQLRLFLRPRTDKYYWLFSHGGNMIGGFIAAVTAFSTQTMFFLPGFLQWAWPSLVGIPIISVILRGYRSRLANGTPLHQLVELKR